MVNRTPTSENEVSNIKYVDDSVGEGTLLRFNQTLTNILKVSVGNDTYNLTKFAKIQYTDTTEVKFLNRGSDLLQKCNIKGFNKNNDSKVGNLLKSTITNHPPAIQERLHFPHLVIVSCISKLVQIITVTKECLLALNGLILYKLVILLSIIIDFQF